MSAEYELNTIEQFAALTPDQFRRMLPDFVVWHGFSRIAQALDVKAVGFRWVDDGRAGEIHSVNIIASDTGKRYTIDGPDAQPKETP